MRRLAFYGRISRNIVVIGATDHCRRLTTFLEAQNNPWIRILGIFDDRQLDCRRRPVHRYVRRYPLLGNVNDLFSYAREQRVDDIIIALPWIAEERILSILDSVKMLPVRSHLWPDVAGFHFRRCTYLGSVPLLEIVEKPLSDWSYVLKAIQDRTLAFSMLLLMSPVMGFIALCIKLESSGPVFFRPRRYGFNNQLIEVFKFRTMRVECQDTNAERLTTRNDPRLTRVGAFLRRTSLDELPQLINVLKGEMSVVGPRPHALKAKAEGRLYEEVVTNYASRHRV
ncbi:MAG: sugar transferase, partial [Gammaproteobacteria bacterium]